MSNSVTKCLAWIETISERSFCWQRVLWRRCWTLLLWFVVRDRSKGKIKSFWRMRIMTAKAWEWYLKIIIPNAIITLTCLCITILSDYTNTSNLFIIHGEMIFKRKIWINRNWFCLGKSTQWGQDEYKLCSLLITFFGVKCKNETCIKYFYFLRVKP